MKKTLKRVLALILCAAMLLPLVPAATAVTAEAKGLSKSTLPPYVKEAPAVKESKAVFKPNAATAAAKARPVRAIDGPYENGPTVDYDFETFEDLKTLAAGTYTTPTGFSYVGEEALTISEDLTLPENTYLYVYGKLLIPAGVTFTTLDCGWGSSARELEVNGIFNCGGFFNVYQKLTVNGKIYLSNSMALEPEVMVSGLENIIGAESWNEVYCWHYISTDSELHNALAIAAADTSGLHHDIYFQPDADVTFSKSFTIPANGRVSLQNGVTFTAPSSVTVTVNGTMDMYAWGDQTPVLKVAGKLVNNNSISISFENDASQMLVFTDTGKYSGNGSLQLNSYSETFEWTDVVTGLDTTNLEITGGDTWYNIQDVSNKIKLSAPKNPTWHKLAEWVDDGYQMVDRKGAIAWEDGEVKDPSSEYQYYFIQVYKDGEPFYWWRWGYTDYFKENGLLLSIDASVEVTEVEWESGTYYFTVQAIPNPYNTTSDYRASDIVTSSTWKYTKPGDLATPTNLAWNWPSMKWSGPSGHEYYYVEIQYAPTENGEFQFAYGIQMNMSAGYTLNASDLELMATNYGAGYYRFKVQALSADITKNYHSNWSAYSDTYYFDGSLELEAPTLKATNVASTGKIKLTWNKVEGAEKYEVYRATSKTGTYSLLKTTTGTSLTNTSVDVGKTYYYKICAVASDGTKSEFSDIVSRTCDLPRPEVTVSNTSAGKLKLSWKKIEGAAKYEVYRATSKDGTYSKLTTVTGTGVTNTSAESGKTYYYKVKAIHEKSAANSAYSSVVSGTCGLEAPVVTAANVASSGKIKLSWNKVEGAAKYEVYRATSKTGTYTKLTTTTGTSITNTSAEAGKTYYYKVKAIHSDSAANSPFSEVVSRTCDLPRPDVTVTNVASSGKIKLSWKKIEGAAKYEVYRATSKDGTYTKLTTTTGTSITNTSAEAGKTYYYKVKAIHEKSAANSAYSAVDSRTCDLAQPTLTLKLNSKGKPSLSWKKVEGAVKYQVYYSTSKDGTYSLLKTMTGTSLTHSSATAGKTYYYKIRAVAENTDANSAYSAIKSISVK